VGRGDDDLLGALGPGASAAFAIVPPVSIMSSTRTQTRPGDVTDDPVGDGLVGRLMSRRLVDEGQRCTAETLGPLLGDLDPAGIGRDDRELPSPYFRAT
jgi:hypothetical protein